MSFYPHLLPEKVPASCVAQLPHVAIIHDVRIFRNVNQYRLPGVLPTSHSSHKDEACVDVVDPPAQVVLVPYSSSYSLPSNFVLYKPYCTMYDSTLSGVRYLIRRPSATR